MTAEDILERIAAAVEVREQLVVRSTGSEEASLRLDLPLDEATARPTLAAFLYANYYAFDPDMFQAVGLDNLTILGLRVSDAKFLKGLRAANPGNGYLVGGWQVVERLSYPEMLVKKEGVTLLIRAFDHLQPEQYEAAAGDVVSIRFPKDSALGSPGFYLAFSDAGPATGPLLMRVYFNLAPQHAEALTAELLSRLLRLGIPYTYKVLADPERFRRRDTAVLYLAKADLSLALQQVCAVRELMPEAFRSAVPSFTDQVGDGVGVAQSPAPQSGAEVSFGEHRTNLVAEAICRCVAVELKAAPFSRQLLRRTIDTYLLRAGLSPTALHLGPSEGVHLDRDGG